MDGERERKYPREIPKEGSQSGGDSVGNTRENNTYVVQVEIYRRTECDKVLALEV